MADDQNWIELDKHNFKLSQVFKMDPSFKSIDHPNMLIAAAGFGGPIALTSDKSKALLYKSKDLTLKNILFYDNQGKLMGKTPFEVKEIVMLFDWLEDQSLIAVLQGGKYFIADPICAEPAKEYDLTQYLKGSKITSAKVVENGFVVFTADSAFFVKNAHSAQAIELKSLGVPLPIHAQGWCPLPSKFSPSSKVEVQVAHPQAGVVVFVQSESRKIYYNRNIKQHMIQEKLPHFPGVRLIAQSGRRRLIAYFSCIPRLLEKSSKDKSKQQPVQSFEHKLFVVSNDYQASTSIEIALERSKEARVPLSMHWVGEDAVLLSYQKGVQLVSMDNNRVRVEEIRSEKLLLFRQESDSLRVLNQSYNCTLAKVPPPYERIFTVLSQSPASQLYHAFDSFQKKQPLQDDQIRSKKDLLAEAVKDCLRAAKFQQDSDEAIKLMRAAVYGKSFLSSEMIDNTQFQQQCKSMRVANVLRTVAPKRIISFGAVQTLTEQTLLKVLLRYRHHFAAMEIAKYLKKGEKFKLKIYSHWACCKVGGEGSAEEICSVILNKVQKEKNFSFTEIAQRAIELGKSELALRLLEYEKSVSKKVPLLLWIGEQSGQDSAKFFLKAVEEAAKSYDVNLVTMVVQRFRKCLTEEVMFEVFAKYDLLRSCLVSYLKVTDVAALIRFYAFTRNEDEQATMIVRQSLKLKGKEQIVLLKNVLEIYKRLGSWKKDALVGQLKNLEDYELMREDSRNKSKETTFHSIHDFHLLLLSKNKDEAERYAKQYQINEARGPSIRLAHLMKVNKWEDVEEYVQKNAKKLKYQAVVLADRFKRLKQVHRAEKMAAYVCSRDEDIYYILHRIDWIKKAVELACENKMGEVVESIVPTINDPELRNWAEGKLEQLRKRK